MEHHVNVIIFPELSLTGYESDIANKSTIGINDKRLAPLKSLSRQHEITIVAGAPVENPANKPYIGALIIRPEDSFTYRKNYLHPGEEIYFSESKKISGIFEVNGTKIGVAICADIDHEEHAKESSRDGARIYAAGVLIMGGYSEAAGRLQHYAIKYSMITLMANYGQPTGGYLPAGTSAAWDNSGNLLTETQGTGESLVIITGDADHWSGIAVPI